MRKLICMMICILLVMTMSVTAFAGEEDGSETPPPESHTHAWDGGTVTTPATCKDAGVMTFACSGCTETRTEAIAATGVHTYGSWQNVDGSTHKRACTGCGAEETGNHAWDGGTVNPQPTCSKEGLKTYSCGCGATKTETLAVEASAHTYGEWGGNEDVHTRTCSGCGNTDSGNHSWDGGTVTMPATCKENGVEALVCSVCSGFLYEVIPAAHTYDDVCDPDCNACGETRDAGHNYSKTWSKNSSEHWHVCTKCGDKKDVADHYPGPAATEEKAQICLTCGLTMTPKLNHVHKYATVWTSDETGHWYACDGCEMQKDFQEHSYDDPCDPDCNVCGYTTANAHSFDGTWFSSETGHWVICSRCGEESEEEAHIPDPDVAETEAQLCTVCEYEMAPPKEHTHEFKSWVADEASHWKECECGEKAEEGLHTWDKGTENKDSTVTFTCTVCQAEQIEEASEDGGILWWLVILLVVLILACAGAVAAIVLILRSSKNAGKFTR